MSDSNTSVVNSSFSYNGVQYSLPYIKENQVIASSGIWKGMQGEYKYTPELIQKIYDNTDWTDKEVTSLFVDHQYGGKNTLAKDWVGFINNARLDGDKIIGDIEIADMQMAIKLVAGAKFGLSSNLRYSANPHSRELTNAIMDNCSIVINPAMKTNYINNSELKDEGIISMGERVEEGVMNMSEETKTEKVSDGQLDKLLEMVGQIQKDSLKRDEESKKREEALSTRIMEFEKKMSDKKETETIGTKPEEQKKEEPKKEDTKEPDYKSYIDELKSDFEKQIKELKESQTKIKEPETKEVKTEVKEPETKTEETDKAKIEQKTDNTNNAQDAINLLANELNDLSMGK